MNRYFSYFHLLGTSPSEKIPFKQRNRKWLYHFQVVGVKFTPFLSVKHFVHHCFEAN